METILNELWKLLSNDFYTKTFLLVIIYCLLKISRRVKLLGIYLQAQDHAIEKIIANGKGKEYSILRQNKIDSLMKEDNFENQFKGK